MGKFVYFKLPAYPERFWAYVAWRNADGRRRRVRQWVHDECMPAEKRLLAGEDYKTVLNELVAYIELANNSTLSGRSRLLMTYALCGFANFSSIAIQIGGIGALAPERRKDLAKLGRVLDLGGGGLPTARRWGPT